MDDRYVQAAHAYAAAVVQGDVVACKWVRAACQRHLDDLARSESDPEWPWRFDPDRASANRDIVTDIYDLPDDHSVSSEPDDEPSGVILWVVFASLVPLFMAIGWGIGELIEGAMQ